jgi:hypothetical protein
MMFHFSVYPARVLYCIGLSLTHRVYPAGIRRIFLNIFWMLGVTQDTMPRTEAKVLMVEDKWDKEYLIIKWNSTKLMMYSCSPPLQNGIDIFSMQS